MNRMSDHGERQHHDQGEAEAQAVAPGVRLGAAAGRVEGDVAAACEHAEQDDVDPVDAEELGEQPEIGLGA